MERQEFFVSLRLRRSVQGSLVVQTRERSTLCARCEFKHIVCVIVAGKCVCVCASESVQLRTNKSTLNISVISM